MLLLFISLLLTAPAFAQEAILLNVNQTHSLQWDWAQGDEGPIRQFVFQCYQFRKELEADARQLTFRSFIETPGRYTGCTLSAKNEAGLSAPIVVPDFDYAYSYGTLWRFMLETVGSLLAAIGIVGAGVRRLQRMRVSRSTPLALPEPVVVLEKERDYVYHHS